MRNSYIYEHLGWPSRDRVMNPNGSGAEVIAQFAKRKIEKTLSRHKEAEGVEVGILTDNPESSEAPLAIVCDFPRPVSDEVLLHAQKLAWNFSKSLLLITIEPQIVRSWSCCEYPVDLREWDEQNRDNTIDNEEVDVPQIQPTIPFDESGYCKNKEAAQALEWIELTSGHFFESKSNRFPLEKRADRMLLKNLKEVRNLLRENGLADRFSHDLLARIIFIQFLFDREDSEGRAALNEDLLYRLQWNGVLSQQYKNLQGILQNYEDAYSLFEILNNRFNGDLFPGDSRMPSESQEAWKREKENVRPEHLEFLADFVSGEIEFESGQRSLWPMYAFDAIPLEFISSIYEEFVSKEDGTGVHYTPGHLVDYMLDRVLPWDSTDWDLRILDPSCGSGIFLVKAFQRLIYRWKKAHPGESIPPSVLRRILADNLVGIDKDRDAARVASFSLYLAMCDEIDPRDLWRDAMVTTFPHLRDRNIRSEDFFEVDFEGHADSEVDSFDLVIGNPPYGEDTIESPAREWMVSNDWSVPYKNVGTLFLARAAQVAKPSGRICMIQSASVLLSMRGSTAVQHRKEIFTNLKVTSVTNLAAYRPFENVNEPACIVELENAEPDGEAFWYECPKRTRTGQDAQSFILDPHDVHQLYPDEVIQDPWKWSALMWGGQRDVALIDRLKDSPTLKSLEESGEVKTRQGIWRGNREQEIKEIYGYPLFEKSEFGSIEEGLYLSDKNLPTIQTKQQATVHSRDSTNFSAFNTPQLLIKMSWVKDPGRWQARVVDSKRGVVCSGSYITVHVSHTKQDILDAACLTYNSKLANYYFFLTSARFAFDHRPEPLKKQVLSMPLPICSRSPLDPESNEWQINRKETVEDFDLSEISSFDQIDQRTFGLFSLSEAESILIEDLIEYDFADWKNLSNSPMRESTARVDDETGREEPHLWKYCDIFGQVLKSAYGSSMKVRSTIFTEASDKSPLPIRYVGIRMSPSGESNIRVKEVESQDLRDRLNNLYSTQNTPSSESSRQRRCIRSYRHSEGEETTSIDVYIAKPDQIHYWARSEAMRDADAVSADLRTVANSTSEQKFNDSEAILA